MKIRKHLTTLLVLFVLLLSSCSLEALGRLGDALDKSGTNTLGLNGQASTKQANEAVNRIFDGSTSIFSSPAKNEDGSEDPNKTKLDKLKDGLDSILGKLNEMGEDGNPTGTLKWQDGKLTDDQKI